jgi:hypothetical protein
VRYTLEQAQEELKFKIGDRIYVKIPWRFGINEIGFVAGYVTARDQPIMYFIQIAPQCIMMGDDGVWIVGKHQIDHDRRGIIHVVPSNDRRR